MPRSVKSLFSSPEKKKEKAEKKHQARKASISSPILDQPPYGEIVGLKTPRDAPSPPADERRSGTTSPVGQYSLFPNPSLSQPPTAKTQQSGSGIGLISGPSPAEIPRLPSQASPETYMAAPLPPLPRPGLQQRSVTSPAPVVHGSPRPEHRRTGSGGSIRVPPHPDLVGLPANPSVTRKDGKRAVRDSVPSAAGGYYSSGLLQEEALAWILELEAAKQRDQAAEAELVARQSFGRMSLGGQCTTDPQAGARSKHLSARAYAPKPMSTIAEQASLLYGDDEELYVRPEEERSQGSRPLSDPFQTGTPPPTAREDHAGPSAATGQSESGSSVTAEFLEGEDSLFPPHAAPHPGPNATRAERLAWLTTAPRLSTVSDVTTIDDSPLTPVGWLNRLEEPEDEQPLPENPSRRLPEEHRREHARMHPDWYSRSGARVVYPPTPASVGEQGFRTWAEGVDAGNRRYDREKQRREKEKRERKEEQRKGR